MYHELESWIIGDRDAIEAEYGYDVDAPFGILQFFDGEMIGWLTFETLNQAKMELSEADRKAISYL